jgi:hypothetical protein
MYAVFRAATSKRAFGPNRRRRLACLLKMSLFGGSIPRAGWRMLGKSAETPHQDSTETANTTRSVTGFVHQFEIFQI